MKIIINKTAGFTLMELLVSVAIVGILATISIANFQEFQIRAYDAHTHSMISHMHTAIQAGISDIDTSLSSGNLSAQTYPSGVVAGNSTLADLVPGIPQDSEMFISVYIPLACLNGFSSTANCLEYTIAAAHCKGTVDNSGGGGNYILQHDSYRNAGFTSTWAPWFAVYGC